MKDKSEVFHLFVNFYRMVQTQFESPIKRLRYDNGREYVIPSSLRKMELFMN